MKRLNLFVIVNAIGLFLSATFAIGAVTGPVMMSPSPGVSGNVPMMSGASSLTATIMSQSGNAMTAASTVPDMLRLSYASSGVDYPKMSILRSRGTLVSPTAVTALDGVGSLSLLGRTGPSTTAQIAEVYGYVRSFSGTYPRGGFGVYINGGTSSTADFLALSILDDAIESYVPLVTKTSLRIKGTSGAVTHNVAATTASYTLTDPSTAPSGTQAMQCPNGGGQCTWFTPIASTGTNYSGCTTVSSTGGLVTACDTTARVPTTRNVYTSNGLAGGSSLAGDLNIYPTYGTAANTVMQGNDTRVVNAVPNTRTVTCGNGLTQSGGPALSSNITCNVAAGDGSITTTADGVTVGQISDTQHGSRGGYALHVVAAAGYNGFMSAADKVKSDSWSGLSSSVPASPGAAAPSAGSSTYASRADHRHPDTIDLTYWSDDGINYVPYRTFGTSDSIILDFPVYWGNMPSDLAVWMTWTYSNFGAPTTCYMSLYTNSTTKFTLGSTAIFTSASTSVAAGTSHTQDSISWTFTKPTSTCGTRCRVQMYGHCGTTGAVKLGDVHIHITGAS